MVQKPSFFLLSSRGVTVAFSFVRPNHSSLVKGRLSNRKDMASQPSAHPSRCKFEYFAFAIQPIYLVRIQSSEISAEIAGHSLRLPAGGEPALLGGSLPVISESFSKMALGSRPKWKSSNKAGTTTAPMARLVKRACIGSMSSLRVVRAPIFRWVWSGTG